MERQIEKLLIKEYAYTKADCAYKQGLVSKSYSSFFKEVYDKIGKAVGDKAETKPLPMKETANLWKDRPQRMQAKAKRLYREISKRTHPDADSTGQFAELFAASALAYDACNMLELYEICDELFLPYEIYDEEVADIRSIIDGNRRVANRIANSFIYQWSVEVDTNAKDALLERFIKATEGKL